MHHPRRAIGVLASVLAAALLTVGLPHQHDHTSSASHPAQSCRICRVQESFSATPPSSALQHLLAVSAVFRAVTPQTVVSTATVDRSTGPRAPPALS